MSQIDPLAAGPAPDLAPEVFRRRRERLLASAGDGVVLVGAAPELVRSRDAEVRYRPSTDLYYLTGLPEPESLALLSPHDPAHRFTLFVRPRDPEREVWNGPRVGVEAAGARFGADAVYPIAELDQRLPELVRRADRVIYPVGDAALDRRVLALLAQARRGRPRSGEGPTGLLDLAALLDPLRRIKATEELERMRVAARIAAQGHRAAIGRVAPGVGEWEVEAALEGTMRALGATGPAFPSIVGSGPNATVLHYTSNHRRVGQGELVLIDAGAEWGMYCSDITRTVPASGRFSAPQRELYDIVLAAEEAGIAAARPGAPVGAIHDAATRVLAEGMLALGLLGGMGAEEALETGAHRRFYMHQTSHWLGLDVHDVGAYREQGQSVPLQADMVLTVEPGIYVPPDAADIPERFRGIGIRIEDSVRITAEGHEILTRDVPVQPAALEALVGRA